MGEVLLEVCAGEAAVGADAGCDAVSGAEGVAAIAGWAGCRAALGAARPSAPFFGG